MCVCYIMPENLRLLFCFNLRGSEIVVTRADALAKGEGRRAKGEGRRAKIGRQFRLFLRYDAKAKVIVFAWVNDEV